MPWCLLQVTSTADLSSLANSINAQSSVTGVFATATAGSNTLALTNSQGADIQIVGYTNSGSGSVTLTGSNAYTGSSMGTGGSTLVGSAGGTNSSTVGGVLSFEFG